MSLEQQRLRNIISAHTALARAYDKVISDIEADKFWTSRRFGFSNPFRLVASKEVNTGEKLHIGSLFIFYVVTWRRQFLSFLLSLILFPIRGKVTEDDYHYTFKRTALKFLVSYLVRAHIKRNYEALYTLYLRELMAGNKGSIRNNEIDEIRQITSDTKNYSDTLPGFKKMAATIIGILIGAGALFPYVQSGTRLGEIISPEIIGTTVALIIAGPIIAAMIMVIPLVEAFRIKRALFLNADNIYQVGDIYLGTEQALYMNSIYRLENNIYEQLHDSRKPKEIPFDIIFANAFGLTSLSLWIYAFVVVFFVQINIFAQHVVLQIILLWFFSFLLYGVYNVFTSSFLGLRNRIRARLQ